MNVRFWHKADAQSRPFTQHSLPVIRYINMNQIPIKLICVIAVFICSPLNSFADTVSHESNLTGKFVYPVGKQILMLNLAQTKKGFEKIYKSHHRVPHMSALTKVDEMTFLFHECNALGKCAIMKYDFKTEKVRQVRSGTRPTYISSTKEILFYDREEKNGEQWLYKQKLDMSNKPEKITRAPPSKTMPNSDGFKFPTIEQPIVLSPDEALVVGEDTRLWRYRVSDTSLQPTGIEDCIPRLWRSKEEQLLCLDWNTRKYYWLGLEDKTKKEMDASLKHASGFVYVSETDSLIYHRVRVIRHSISKQPIEIWDIYHRSLDSKNEALIQNDVFFILSGLWFK